MANVEAIKARINITLPRITISVVTIYNQTNSRITTKTHNENNPLNCSLVFRSTPLVE